MGPEKKGVTRRKFLEILGIGVTATTIDCLDNSVWAQVYREGQRVNKKEAIIGIFPEKLKFEPGRRTLIVSRAYQTAAVYDEKGNLMKLKKGDKHIPLLIKAESFIFQAGTGSYSTPTPLGIGEIVSHKNEDYVAQSGESAGASMSNAMHLDQFTFNMKGEKNYLDPFRGIAVHGRHTTTGDYLLAHMSHACVGVEKEMAKFLQSILKKRDDQRHISGDNEGDYVLVVDDEIPQMNSLKEVVVYLNRKDLANPIPEDDKFKSQSKSIWKPYEGENMQPIHPQAEVPNTADPVKLRSIWEKYIKKTE